MVVMIVRGDDDVWNRRYQDRNMFWESPSLIVRLRSFNVKVGSFSPTTGFKTVLTPDVDELVCVISLASLIHSCSLN